MSRGRTALRVVVGVVAVVAVGAMAWRSRQRSSPPSTSTPAASTKIAVDAEPAPAADGSLEEPDAAVTAISLEPARSLLLITVDTLRGDQPWTGYMAIETPRLSALAAESVVYTRAYSVSNTTTSSLAAVMTARYPSEMQRDDCGFAGFKLENPLASVLSRAGIHGMAAHAHAIFASSFAPKEGFDEWRVIPGVGGKTQENGAITGNEVAGLVVSFLRSPSRPARFFAWVHFVDPHDAYAAHADIPPSATPLRGPYDAEVIYTDRAIGTVLDALRDEGLDETTAVIVTGDHGEAFGEHQRFRHGHTLYDEEIHVPLLVRAPGVAPRRIETPRSGIDLARTAAALLGVAPEPTWRGVSWTEDWDGAPAPRPILVDRPEFANLRALRATIDDRRKATFHDGRPLAAFDLAADPSELTPLDATASAEVYQRAGELFAGLQAVATTPCRRDR